MSEKETELEKATESGRISEADAADLSGQDKARKHRKTAKAAISDRKSTRLNSSH